MESMHTMLQGNHNLSALMQQHHLLSNSNHNQFGFSSGAQAVAQQQQQQQQSKEKEQMLQQTLAFHQLLQHQLIATQQQQQLQQLQQIKDKRSSPNPIQSSLQNSLATAHGHLLSGLPSLPLPLPQTPTSVSTNHKADSEKSHSPVAKQADERTKSPFDANANRFSPKKSPTPR